tara:strand:- start:1599 stop:1862 length:264 start_codon:yes stop_codon:yes gene_type:complete
MSEEKKDPGQLIKFGALWNSKGKSLFTGSVNNDIRIVVLANQRKEKDNQPDAFIFLAKKEWDENKEDSSSPSTNTESSSGDKSDLPF